MRPGLVLLAILIFAAPGSSQELEISLPADCGALQITGTFSDIRFDDHRQGLTGAEIRIVATENGYQASLQFANGKLSNLYLADVEFNVDLRYWPLGVPLPEHEPDTDSVRISVAEGPYAGTLTGKVTKTHLAGVLHLVSGDHLNLNIPRGKGYWD